MKLGMIGLGKMGCAIASRLVGAGHEVIGYDPSADACGAACQQGIIIVESPAAVAQHQLWNHDRRVIWLMVPAGPAVDENIFALVPHLHTGDVIIDGGNSHFSDTRVRAQQCAQHNISFIDVGVSGGLQARELGFCLMVGGERAVYENLRPLFDIVAMSGGHACVGPSGAGHYVKMVHNGIEYGLLQTYAEGLQLLHENKTCPHLDVDNIISLWQHGAIIRSWVLTLVQYALAQDPKLHHTSGVIEEGGTGRWVAQEAEKNKIQVPVLQAALQVRERSRAGEMSYATKLIARLRNVFGGHRV
jgi:6-phosphogluconate dehydrogenase